MAICCTLPRISVSFYPGESSYRHSIPEVPSLVLSWKKGSPSFELLALLNAAQSTVVLLCCKTTLLAHVHLGVHQDTQVLFWKAPLQIVSLHPCTARLFFLRCHFSLLNFRRLLLAQHFSQHPSECQHNCLVYQSPLQVSHHVQTCRGHALHHCLGHLWGC